MKLKDFIIPKTVREARAALKKLGDNGLVVAGGTALHFYGDQERTAVDITRIGLSGIRKKGGICRVGATTTLAELMAYSTKGWVLDLVARQTSTQQVRNISTLGGNVARVFPWADFPVVLLALDAEFVLLGKKERVVTADEFFDGQPARLLKHGDLLAWVEVPLLKAGQGFGFHKEKRVSASFSLMTMSALITIKGGKIREARVAAGSGVPFPRRLTAVEDLLKGRAPSAEVIAEAVRQGTAGVPWKGKEGMSDEYAAQLARVVLADVLEAALRQAKGGRS